MHAAEYEDALRYVFDRCGRGGGPDGLAEADVYRGARNRKDWSRVARGLGLALERVIEDSGQVEWTATEDARAGVTPNFNSHISRATTLLQGTPDEETWVRVACNLVHALKAITLKAADTATGPYEGEIE